MTVRGNVNWLSVRTARLCKNRNKLNIKFRSCKKPAGNSDSDCVRNSSLQDLTNPTALAKPPYPFSTILKGRAFDKCKPFSSPVTERSFTRFKNIQHLIQILLLRRVYYTTYLLILLVSCLLYELSVVDVVF